MAKETFEKLFYFTRQQRNLNENYKIPVFYPSCLKIFKLTN